MENPSESVLHFDLACTPPHELRTAVRSLAATLDKARADEATTQAISVMISGARGQDFVGAGLRDVGEVAIKGSIGDFGFCSFGDGQCLIEGNVEDFFGHSIVSGMLIVHGHTKHGVGALGSGGLIAVYGCAQDRAAIGLQGADVVVRGSVANYAGLGMQSGTLIIGSSAGSHLGHGMSGGTIYIRGEVESVSPDIEEQRLREPDRLKIGMLMLKSNIKSSGKEFRVYRAVREDS